MHLISPPRQHHAEGVVVEYKTQAARQDRRHLVVVFSGFCPIGRYNFDGTVAEGCRFGILWVNDVFDGNNCYYLARGMDFGVEAAVISLILSELERLGLSKDECTLFGYSKGGSAALYFGLKYDFPNIVASAPQMHVGTFAKNNFHDSYRHMVGEAGDEEESRKILDSLLPALLRQDTQLKRSIYIVSSHADQFHEQEVGAYLSDFSKYTNFNLIMTDSELVREHKTVGRYNTPILLSILYALGEGSVPAFPVGRSGQGEYYSSRRIDPTALDGETRWVITCDRLSLDTERLFVEGVALLQGLPQTKYSDKTIRLMMKSAGASRDALLGSIIDTTISDRFYDKGFCDYSTAGYKTLHGNGIDLSALPAGVYALSLSVSTGGQQTEVPLPYPRTATTVGFSDNFYYHVGSTSEGVVLTKRHVLGRPVSDGLRQVKRLEIVEGALHIEGVFAIPGIDYSKYDNNLFSLVLESAGRTHRLALGQGDRPQITDVADSGFGNYSKSYFANRGYKGYDLSSLIEGEYMLHISAFIGATVFTMPVHGCRLAISKSGAGSITTAG